MGATAVALDAVGMQAQPFNANLDPDAVIEMADDGTPLFDHKGWTCYYCERLFATVAEADACCARPAQVKPDFVVGE